MEVGWPCVRTSSSQDPPMGTIQMLVSIGYRCFADMRTSGGPILALVYSIFPVIATGIITVCYVGVWVTIKVNIWVAK